MLTLTILLIFASVFTCASAIGLLLKVLKWSRESDEERRQWECSLEYRKPLNPMRDSKR